MNIALRQELHYDSAPERILQDGYKHSPSPGEVFIIRETPSGLLPVEYSDYYFTAPKFKKQ